MSKRVILRLEGDIQKGFRVGLELGQQGEQPEVEMQGRLPSLPNLPQNLDRWQLLYRNLGVPTRLKPKSVNRYTDNDWLSTTQRRPLDECRRSADVLQKNLVNWLESPEFRNINKVVREELNRDDTIEIMIRADDPNLRLLPWHLWDFVEHYPKAEIAFGSLDSRKIRRNRKPKKNVRILAILGNSTGINVESDLQMLYGLPNVALTFLVEPKRQEINDQLWDQDWDVLFFAGHSETVGSKGIIHINRDDSLSIEDLRYGLNQAIDKGLQLAIFNSCDGLGLARELEHLHIPQMIVMRQPVPDYVAQEFLKCFLKFYAEQGQPFYVAERRAREWLQGLESEFPCASWLPIIFQNPTEVPPTWMELRGKQQETNPYYQNESSQLFNSPILTDYRYPDDIYKQALLERLESQKMDAPIFREDEIAPIPYQPGTQSDKGIVKEEISAHRVGKVQYQGTYWSAYFRYPSRAKVIEIGQEVEAMGFWNNTLLVMPDNQEKSEKPKRSWHSFLSSFFNRK
jgi:hypothetical protein